MRQNDELDPEAQVSIGPASKINIALLGGIFATAVMATYGGARWATRVEGRLEIIETKLSTPQVPPDRWTQTDMRVWVERLKASNPTISVPPSEHIGGSG